MSTEVKEMLTDLNKDFRKFQEVHEEEMKAIKEDKGTAEIKTKLEKYQDRMDALEVQIQKANAARTQDTKVKGDPEVNEAYKAYYLKGDKISETQKSAILKENNKRNIKSMSTDSFADGGIFSRNQFDTDIINLLIETSPVRQFATVKTLPTGDAWVGSRKIRRSTTSWTGERSSTGDTQTPQYAELRIQTHEQEARPRLSRQQLEDSIVAIENELQTDIREEFGYDQNTAFISGDGVNKPEGILPGLVDSTNSRRQDFGAAGTLDADEIIDMAYSVKSQYLQNAGWMFNRLTLREIRKLKDNDGRYIWYPGQEALTGGNPATLLGYTYALADDLVAPNVSTGAFSNGDKPIIFGDFARGYYVIDRLNNELLVDPYSAKPFIEYYFRTRVGGQVVQPEALKFAEFTS